MPRFSKRNDRKPHYGGKSSAPKSRRRPQGRRPQGRKQAAEGGETLVRLQKVLAAAGIGSRRHCEELIVEGRVDVDGQTVTELGTRVDPDRQEIYVDGERLRRSRRVYFLVNKPIGVISTNYDPTGRARVVDFAPSNERLFTIGRLDKSSDGLILVTNDGELTDLLTHPRYGVEKTYLAEVAGMPSAESLQKMRKGVHLAEGFAHAKRVHVRRARKQSTVMEIVLDEGRNREVRRLLARIGHKVMKLRRIAMGPLRLGNLKPGESRVLRADEVEELYQVARDGRRSERKSKTSKTGKQDVSTTKPVAEKGTIVRPIIDKSLPADTPADDESFLFADLPPVEDELADFESDADDKQAASMDNAELAPVDLRPFTPGGLRRKDQQMPTVIGAKPQARGSRQRRGEHGGKSKMKRRGR